MKGEKIKGKPATQPATERKGDLERLDAKQSEEEQLVQGGA
jgi:hypothetical protein